MNKSKPACGNALNRRELLRLLGASGAVAAAPALDKIVRAGEPVNYRPGTTLNMVRLA